MSLPNNSTQGLPRVVLGRRAIYSSRTRRVSARPGSSSGASGLAVWATRLLVESTTWYQHGAVLGGLVEAYSPSTQQAQVASCLITSAFIVGWTKKEREGVHMFHGGAVRMGAAVDRISRLCNPLSQLARMNDRTEMQGQRNQTFSIRLSQCCVRR
jgi:hypothetical protein